MAAWRRFSAYSSHLQPDEFSNLLLGVEVIREIAEFDETRDTLTAPQQASGG